MEDLQAGDLIWPKEPDAVVRYNATLGESSPEDSEIWSRERDEYISSVKKLSSLSEEDAERIGILENLSFETFLELYGEGAAPEEVTPYGGRFGVGHVAIVRSVDGEARIVEALWAKGVREIAYDDWMYQRHGQWFWHARLKDWDPLERAEIAAHAATQLGKPYQFWNFDLDDESGFYCSKLAWLAVRDATGVVLDDNPEPDRFLWLSPKQLLRSPHLQVLQNPADYGSPGGGQR